MRMELFDILMVVAPGSSAGAGTGIITGYVTKNQKNKGFNVFRGTNHKYCTGLFSFVRYSAVDGGIISWRNNIFISYFAYF